MSKTKYQEVKPFKVLWGIYALFIIYGTIIPFNLVPSIEFVLSNYDKISWVPFIDTDGSRASIPDVVQNILLFLPFGFLGLLSIKKPRWGHVLSATLFGSLLSSCVEIFQLFSLDRTTSTTDLVTNTVGAFLGAAAAIFSLKLISKAFASRSLQKHIQILLNPC